MTRGGRRVKTTLYSDRVHDSYAICPEKLLKNEYWGKNDQTWAPTDITRSAAHPELSHIEHNILVERVWCTTLDDTPIRQERGTYTGSTLTSVGSSMLHEPKEASWGTGTARLPHLQSERLVSPILESVQSGETKLWAKPTSTPEIPTPTWAAWIMLTSLAPSPMASRIDFWFFLTSLTTRAFWRGDTRPIARM